MENLYQIIKQKSQEKGRPLKVVSDWDECIQPVNPYVWYKLVELKGWNENQPLPSFEEWFNNFWKEARMEFKEEGIRTKCTPIKEVEEFRGDKEKFEEEVRKPFFKILNDENYYEEAPFLTIAKNLSKACNEGLISELVFISTTAGVGNGRKRTVCKKYFTDAYICLRPQGHHTNTGELRWKWAKNNHPDFDVFIDDHPNIIKDFKANFSDDKILVMPDYPIVEAIEGIYRVQSKPEISLQIAKIAKNDFVAPIRVDKKVAKEENQPIYSPWIIGGVCLAIGLIIGVLSAYFIWRKEKAKDGK
jgi:hypothetical protein